MTENFPDHRRDEMLAKINLIQQVVDSRADIQPIDKWAEGRPRVYWAFGGDSSEERKKIQHAVMTLTHESKRELLPQLLEATRDWSRPDITVARKKLFGEQAILRYDCSRGYMGTLTATGKQFRIWYGVPASFGPEHVDSCGADFLADITGHREYVESFVSAVFPKREDILLPNGCKIIFHDGKIWSR
jgi:hypothetical protein